MPKMSSRPCDPAAARQPESLGLLRRSARRSAASRGIPWCSSATSVRSTTLPRSPASRSLIIGQATLDESAHR